MAGNRNNNKRTEGQKEMLIKKGAQWLFDHPTAPQGAFVKWIMEEAGFTSKAQAYKYRKWSYEKVAELQDEHIESKRTLRVAALERLFHQAQQSGDIKAQLAVLQELNKVDNLYIHRVETNTVEDAPSFTADLEEIQAKLRKVD